MDCVIKYKNHIWWLIIIIKVILDVKVCIYIYVRSNWKWDSTQLIFNDKNEILGYGTHHNNALSFIYSKKGGVIVLLSLLEKEVKCGDIKLTAWF